MKITKSELKQMIKEELQQTIAQEQQLDEAPILPLIMSALKNPAVQKMLMDMLMPMIEKAMASNDK
mgnify:CR=1 FL=1|tara:strand:+ start:150 stop:347 length:198 start_codon:yes stop_codon:yes gene_type:complete